MLTTSTVVPPRTVMHVAQLDRRARRHVVGAHQVAGDRRSGTPASAQRGASPRARAGAGHVVLHGRVHGVAGLEADAARVVHDRPCRRAPGGRSGRRPAGTELDHPRLARRCPVDGDHPAAAELDERVAVEHLDRQAGRPRRARWRRRPCRAAAMWRGGVLARSRRAWRARANGRAPRRARPVAAAASAATSVMASTATVGRSRLEDLPPVAGQDDSLDDGRRGVSVRRRWAARTPTAG